MQCRKRCLRLYVTYALDCSVIAGLTIIMIGFAIYSSESASQLHCLVPNLRTRRASELLGAWCGVASPNKIHRHGRVSAQKQVKFTWSVSFDPESHNHFHRLIQISNEMARKSKPASSDTTDSSSAISRGPLTRQSTLPACAWRRAESS